MTSFMPEDLVIGILLRLPVKSLLRFKSVSKSWCATLTSRDFREEHLNNNRAGGCLLAQFYAEDPSDPDLNVYFPDETLADLTCHPFDVPNSREVLHGPCNGIFLVALEQSYYALWNPATKEYRQLPDPDLRWAYCFQEFYGFGLDPITKDYKVVVLQQIEHLNINFVGKVHTLGTEHWKDLKLDCAAFELLHSSTSHTYLDGFYYFHVRNSTALSFDMATDAIEMIPPPNELEPINASYAADECLVVLQDAIALFHLESDENYLRVWMLKEKSWIKQFTIQLQTGVQLEIIGCWNDEILLRSFANRLLLYKPTTREIRDAGIRATSCLGIVAYRESLISIEGEYEYKRQRDLQA